MKTFFSIAFFIGFLMIGNCQIDKVDSLKKLLPNATQEKELEIYLSLAKENYWSSMEDCFNFSKKAYQLSRSIDDPESECDACNYIGDLYFRRGLYDSALVFNNNMLTSALETGDSNKIAHAFGKLGKSYNGLEDYEKAKSYFSQALNIAERHNNKAVMKFVYGNLVITYKAQGEYVEAIEYGLESMKISEEAGDLVSQGQGLINIGNIYGRMGEFQKAMENNRAARQLFIDAQVPQGVALAESNLGVAHIKMDNPDSAIYYYNRALHGYQLLKDKAAMIPLLLNIGALYKKQGKIDEALEYYNEVLSLSDSIGRMNNKARAFNNIGDAFTEKKEYPKAETSYQKSLDLSVPGGWLERISNSYEQMAYLYLTWGKMDKAYHYLEKYVEIKDSIMNEANQRAIAEMQTRFDTEKVEKENEILTQEAEIQSLELKRQQTRFWIFAGGIGFIVLLAILAFVLYRLRQRNIRTKLEKQSLENEQRMLRSQMNPHFIFNSMNSIQSYISGNDNNTAMSYLSKFARLMRGILENSRQSMIPLEDEVETLNLYIELERLRFKNKFEFKMELEPGLDQEGMYVPPMLIQPFVENAIKHGLLNKGGDGLLKLSFTKEDKLIRCIVEDNGIGRDQASLSKTKQTDGHRSLGMQVTRERMDAIKKEMNIDCNFQITDLKDENGQASGTLVEIIIPFEEE